MEHSRVETWRQESEFTRGLQVTTTEVLGRGQYRSDFSSVGRDLMKTVNVERIQGIMYGGL